MQRESGWKGRKRGGQGEREGERKKSTRHTEDLNIFPKILDVIYFPAFSSANIYSIGKNNTRGESKVNKTKHGQKPHTDSRVHSSFYTVKKRMSRILSSTLQLNMCIDYTAYSSLTLTLSISPFAVSIPLFTLFRFSSVCWCCCFFISIFIPYIKSESTSSSFWLYGEDRVFMYYFKQ